MELLMAILVGALLAITAISIYAPRLALYLSGALMVVGVGMVFEPHDPEAFLDLTQETGGVLVFAASWMASLAIVTLIVRRSERPLPCDPPEMPEARVLRRH